MSWAYGRPTGRLPELLAEYADVEKALSDPTVHSEPGEGSLAGAPIRRTRPHPVGRGPSSTPPESDLDRSPRVRGRGPVLRRRGHRLSRHGSTSSRQPTATNCCCPRTPTRARTSSSRSRPVRAVTSRHSSPVICCGCICASPNATVGRPSCSMRNPPILAASSPRRWPFGHAKPTDAVWSPAEVRRRRASCATRAYDRVAGPHPHLGGGRPGVARG